MTLTDYETELKYHDWFYDWSDDQNVWRRGFENEQRLRREAETSDLHGALWRRYRFDKRGEG